MATNRDLTHFCRTFLRAVYWNRIHSMFADHAHKIVLALGLLAVAAPTRISGQTKIDVHLPTGSTKTMNLFPESSRVLFPSSRVLLEMKDARVNLSAANAELLREMELVTASDYSSESTSRVRGKDRRGSPIKITAVVYGDSLYVVNELFFDENRAVINKLLQLLEVHADNEEKALQVANLYLQLAQYRFDEAAHYVVSSFQQLSPEQVKFPGQNMTEIESAIHSPYVKKDGNAYTVDMVTQDVDAAFVLLRHWTIRILDSQIASVQEEVVTPEHMHYRTAEAPSDRFGGTLKSPLTGLRFQLSIMGDGKTPDSKELNLSIYTFNASQGPPVIRSAYFFHSPGRAEREFKDELNQAGQILERGNWIGKSGEIVGERALVLDSTEKANGIRAIILLKQDSKFLNVSSSCLRNVLEFEKAWFGAQSQNK